MRAVALAVALVTLGGCSEYLDRRDTIAASGGDAVYTNRVTHMVDPWPRASANRDIPFNGNTMQAAVQRYRTGRVIPPVGTGTGSTYQAPPAAPPANTAPVGPTITQPAAAVK
jgi:hypothetical protein